MASSSSSGSPSRPRRVELDPRVAERVQHLSLVAAKTVDGFLAGRHRSPHNGVSVEFVDRRPYVQGDDLRHLDWRAYARNDRLAIKRYEEETNLEATMIVDASGSMGYGADKGDGVSKYDYACQIAASLAHLVLRDRDGAAMALFDEKLDRVLQASTSQGHMVPILTSLAGREPEGETDFESVLGRLSDRIARPGIVVLVSDLFGDLDTVARGLDRLCTRGHDSIVLHVMHPDELEFPFDSLTRFEGMETEERLLVDAAALRTSYLGVVERWRADIRRLCHGRNIDYCLLDTGTPLQYSLSAFLGSRMARRGQRR